MKEKVNGKQWLLIGFVLFAVLMLFQKPVKAAEVEPLASPNRCMVGMSNWKTLDITLKEEGDEVKNIHVFSGTSGKKTTSNLFAKLTVNHSIPSYNGDRLFANIQYYSKKAGTYRIQYDIYGKNGTKKETRTERIAVSKTDPGALSMTLDGKRVLYSSWVNKTRYTYTDKQSAIVKFIPAKGCKIIKITMTTLEPGDPFPDHKTSPFTNGKKVAFSKNGRIEENYRDVFAETGFTVEYTDSYSSNKSQVYTEVFVVSSFASEWIEGAPLPSWSLRP